jgi:toxin ParE1/3/4
MYKLEYLPIALNDMVDIARYISQDLKNPDAAIRLSEKMINSAEKIKDSPYINPVFTAAKPLKKEYRRLIVKNYIMFYWVDETEKKIIMARVFYGKRNCEAFLK